jgi:RHS repeat-associated protein
MGALKLSYYTKEELGKSPLFLVKALEKRDTPHFFGLDSFPYGKILRKYVPGGGIERYLTTQHERDHETISENNDGTGLDNRGARFYDSDVARFLSLDPAAAEYASWSDYNYVMGNPIVLIDPDGKRVDWYTPNGSPNAEPTWFEGSDEREGYTRRGEYKLYNNVTNIPGKYEYFDFLGEGNLLDDFVEYLYKSERENGADQQSKHKNYSDEGGRGGKPVNEYTKDFDPFSTDFDDFNHNDSMKNDFDYKGSKGTTTLIKDTTEDWGFRFSEEAGSDQIKEVKSNTLPANR